MLLQSDRDEIELLPALPSHWRDGSIYGMRARGGHTVDIIWRAGRLDHARIRSSRPMTGRIRYGDETAEIGFDAGDEVVVRTT